MTCQINEQIKLIIKAVEPDQAHWNNTSVNYTKRKVHPKIQ